MNLQEKWLYHKEIIKQQTEQLHQVEADLWLQAEAEGQLNPKGSKTFEKDGFNVTITHGNTVKVCQNEASTRPDLFRIKYEFNKTDYKNLVSSQKDFVDACITITPSKPQFKVERI